MSVTTQEISISKGALWTGRILSAIPILMMLFAASTKLLRTAEVVQGFAKSGYPTSQILTVGLLELISTLFYLFPRTSVLGAILMTGVLGGAVDENVRLTSGVVVLPIILGVFVWGGLFFRDSRIRELIPFRR